MGYHSFDCLGVPFRVHQRYTFVRALGVGSYGCVALAHDSLLDVTVAIKKMGRIFNHGGVARHALREVAVLRHLSLCDHSTCLLDFDATFVEWGEIYLVMAPSEANLSQIIRSRQALSNAHLQCFAVQLLRGVRYMHAAHIVHRDLKPSNLLVNADCALRVCDYGLARAWSGVAPTEPKACPPLLQHASSTQHLSSHFSPKTDKPPMSAAPPSGWHPGKLRVRTGDHATRLFYPGEPLSGHVATRWYRAPEILLQFKQGYGPEMDMWSVGCILAELLLGRPLFPGKNYVDQLSRIYNITGSPTQELLAQSSSQSAQKLVRSWGSRPPPSLEAQFPNADPLAVDLVARCLRWDPLDRITAEAALQHPWLDAYKESSARWTPPAPFAAFGQVEFSAHPAGFIAAFQSEAREMHAEWSALAQESGVTMDFSTLHLSPHASHDPTIASAHVSDADENEISRAAADDAPGQSSDSAESPLATGCGTGVTTPSAGLEGSGDTLEAEHLGKRLFRRAPELAMTSTEPSQDACPTLAHGLEVEPSWEVKDSV